MLVLWAGSAAAQVNAPITGAMGGTTDANARAVAAPVTPLPAAGDGASAAGPSQVAQPASTSAATQASRVPSNIVRRTTPLRVGEHAADGMLGDETEALLALQANNLAAGPGLPMLGATASRAYKRYLDSFTYAIPQFYPTMVQTESGVGNNSGSGGVAPAAAGTGASQ
ncbi:hypothetical protein RO07_25465 [Pandoraea pulmonicola]|nr:DUF3613 domain-containing protein [Pandoraea pulmonicola]APD13527.1 hypothetical protein RO07_25465 [Pandoraea pulmonicola]